MLSTRKTLSRSAALIATSIAIALLTACGVNESVNTPLAVINAGSTATKTTANDGAGISADSPFLKNLALAYPNGQMPAAQQAQAAKELSQNPAVLKLTAGASQANPLAKATDPALQTQAVSADYKPVTRIQNTTLTGAYFFSIYPGEVTTALAGNPTWKLEGTAFIASTTPDAALSPVHRFRNKLNGSYLYTIYDSEKTDITTNYASTFVYEGVAWYARQTPAAGWSPLYRFRNLLNGTYLFSAYEEERVSVETNYSAIFRLEGIAYYVMQPCKAAATGSAGYSLVFKACDATNTATYYDKTECVRENGTGLIWQGQTPAGTGLRANNQLKTNYDSTTENQKLFSDSPPPPTQAEIDAISNSIGFKNAVNTTNLCGYNDWRLPTKQELENLVSLSNSPKIDTNWFPNTANEGYWSSTPYPNTVYYTWVIEFLNGNTFHGYRNGYNLSRGGILPGGGFGNFDGYLVRLVR